MKSVCFYHPITKKFAGTDMKGNSVAPGLPGYKEIVDFGEFIGYYVDESTGVKTPTTKGIIH
jgi:hypothetical protein